MSTERFTATDKKGRDKLTKGREEEGDQLVTPSEGTWIDGIKKREKNKNNVFRN